MTRKLLTSLLCIGLLTACDSSEKTSSGGGGDSNAALASQSTSTSGSGGSTTSSSTASNSGSGSTSSGSTSSGSTSSGSTSSGSTSSGSTATATAATTASTQSAGGQSCGVGRYEFRTDADGKFHFDAVFAEGGVIRYNFSVQPNTGRWRITGENMVFNGPFGTGASDHTSSWRITNRSADCSVLQFRGKSYGQADVTASRL